MSNFPSRVPAWARWIPAVLLSIVIVGVVIFAVTEGPRLQAGPGPAETDEVDELNFSVFTDEGLAYIDEQRIPRLDLRELPVETEPLGLPAEGELVIGPHPQDLDYRLVLLADGGAGGARFTTATFSIETAGGEVTGLRIQPPREVASGTFRDIEAWVVEAAARYGYPAPEQGALLQLVLAAQEAGEPQLLSTEPGEAIGLPARIEVVCGAEALCSTEIVVAVE